MSGLTQYKATLIGRGVTLKTPTSVGSSGQSIVVNDAVTGSITIALAAVESAKLSHQKTRYDVKKFTASGATFMSTEGIWQIKASPTRATS